MRKKPIPKPINTRGFRKIHISEDIWLYKHGRSHVVIIPPGGKKMVVSYYKILGYDRAEERSFSGPSDISDYIWKFLIKKTA